MNAKPTTTKIPSEMHARLLRGAKKTGLSKAALLRLCVDIGVPHLEKKFDEMRGKAGLGAEGNRVIGVSLAVGPRQLEELRELYRSAVTDLVPGISGLAGEDFVKAAEKAIACGVVKAPDTERIGRFLAVYQQLF